MQRRIGDYTRSMPVPDHQELRAGTSLTITRQAGLPSELVDEDA